MVKYMKQPLFFPPSDFYCWIESVEYKEEIKIPEPINREFGYRENVFKKSIPGLRIGKNSMHYNISSTYRFFFSWTYFFS